MSKLLMPPSIDQNPDVEIFVAPQKNSNVEIFVAPKKIPTLIGCAICYILSCIYT
jgi:hypothetical protein